MKTATAGGMFAVGVLWGFRQADELLEKSGKKFLNSPYNCAASVLFGANMIAGRWVCSMTFAIVKVLPVPVAPNKT